MSDDTPRTSDRGLWARGFDFVRGWWGREESLSLLLTLLMLAFFVLPFLMPYAPDRAADAVLALLLVSGVAAIGRSQAAAVVTALLVLVSIGLQWSGASEGGGWARLVETVAALGCATIFALLVLARTLVSGSVNSYRIKGAVAAYLLVGWACAIAFELIYLLDPGALLSIEAASSHEMRRQFYYFSTVTLTTVGYGDVTPVSEPARTLATFEGLFGQLYPAIIIGRMISLIPERR